MLKLPHNCTHLTCSKFSKLDFNSTWTVNFQMFKLDLEKAEEPVIKLTRSVGSSKKQESSRKTSTSTLLTMPKPLTVSDQISRSVVSDSLRPHELQHARPPCPSPTPGVHSDSIHWVSDAIQPSHPLLSPSPPDPNPSQHQSLFQRVNSSHEVAKVLEFQL